VARETFYGCRSLARQHNELQNKTWNKQAEVKVKKKREVSSMPKAS